MSEPKLTVLPLLPEAAKVVSWRNLDSAPAVRETLRDYLEEDTTRCRIKEREKILERYKDCVNGIQKAEREMLAVQAINTSIINKTEIDESIVSQERLNFANVSNTSANNFNLLTTNEIHATIFNELSDPSHWNVKEFPCDTLHELLGSDEKQKTLWEITQCGKPEYKKRIARPIFEFSPNEINFNNFELGKKYIKKLKIMNRSKRTVGFYVSLDEESKAFSIMTSIDAQNVIAPGQYITIKIMFKCVDLDDNKNRVAIEAKREGFASTSQFFYVPITAVRMAPTLISEELLLKKFQKGSEKISQSFTIDCGTRLVGSTYAIKANLYNIGSNTTYYISSEYSWEFTNVKSMNASNEIVLNAFTLSPAFFYLRKYEKTSVTVVYKPLCEGVHIEKLYIICDNLTLRNLDVLGEAVLFDTRDICIKAAPKTFDIDQHDIYESPMYVDFGTVYPGGSSIGNCQIFSESLVDIEFGWNILPIVPSKDIFNIPRQNISILPLRGILCSEQSPHEITFRVSMDDCSPGLYKAGLSLVAYNIPKEAVASKKIFTFPNDINPVILTNVEVCYLELSVKVEDSFLIIDPLIVDYTDYVYMTNLYTLSVSNQSDFPVDIYWKTPKSDIIIMHLTPSNAHLEMFESAQFTLEITGINNGPIEEILECVAIQGNKCFKCLVLGNVLMKSAHCNFLAYSSGGVRTGAEESFLMTLKADDAYESHTLDGNEVVSVVDNDEVVLIENFKKNLEGIPCPFNELGLQIKYNLDTQDKGQKASIIEWEYGDHPIYTDIFYFVQDVMVEMKPWDYKLPNDVYIYVPHTITVYLINHSFVLTNYSWGPVHGANVDNVDIKIQKQSGELSGFDAVKVKLKLKCSETGPVSFMIPCLIEYMKTPLVLKISGDIKGMNVEYSWVSKEETIVIPWPSVPTKHYVSPDYGPFVPECCVCMVGQKFEDTNVPMDPNDLIEDRTLRHVDSNTSSIPYQEWPIIGGRFYYDKFDKKELFIDYKHSWNFEDLQARIINNPSNEEKRLLLDMFASKAIVINIKIYQIKKPIGITISNLTPIKTRYHAEIKEFYEKEKPSDEIGPHEAKHLSKENVLKILKNSYSYKINQAEEMMMEKIQDKAGLVLALSNNNGVMDKYMRTQFQLSAFSNCWGVYFDHLRIDIPELEPFHIPIIANVSGKPVWFTFAPKCNQALLRFGTLSSFENRELTVYVYNDSFLDLKIAWTPYTEIPISEYEARYCVPDEPGDFSLNVEFHPTKDKHFCQCHLIDYLGEYDKSYYKCSPVVSYIKSKTKEPLKITVSAANCWFDINNLKKVLKGAICGVVYIDQKEDEDFNFSCYRPDGMDIDPLVLKLETVVTTPVLNFVNPNKDDFIIDVPSYKIASVSKNIYIETKRYLLENTGNTSALCNFSTSGMALLKQLRVFYDENDFDESYKEPSPTVIVKPGYKVELIIDIEIEKKQMHSFLAKHARQLFGNVSNILSLNKKGENIPTYIVIKQGSIEQCIPITIVIKPPKISISKHKLYFGTAFLNQSKLLSFRIRSEFGDEGFMIKLITEHPMIFTVTPHSGTVKQKHFVNIDVEFTPRECLHYTAKISVLTNYQYVSHDLYLEGSGSWDYNYSTTVKY